MSEVIETRGRYRAVLHHDPNGSDMRPDGDYFGFMYSFERGNCSLLAKAYSTDDQAIDHAIEELWEEHENWDTIRTILTTDKHWAPLGVVDMDTLDRRDHTFVCVVTRADLTIWGWADVLGERDGWPSDDDGVPLRPTAHCFTEWEAWADGDVYFYTVEKRVTWTADDEDLDDQDSWVEVDSCHGFYGDEYAREAALESLDCYAPTKASA